MNYTDFTRLRLDAQDCTDLDQFLIEEGGSVDCEDVNLLIKQFRCIMECKTIRDIRAVTDLTQEGFSRAYRIPRRTIEDWEAGKRECSAYVLEMLLFAVISNLEA